MCASVTCASVCVLCVITASHSFYYIYFGKFTVRIFGCRFSLGKFTVTSSRLILSTQSKVHFYFLEKVIAISKKCCAYVFQSTPSLSLSLAFNTFMYTKSEWRWSNFENAYTNNNSLGVNFQLRISFAFVLPFFSVRGVAHICLRNGKVKSISLFKFHSIIFFKRNKNKQTQSWLLISIRSNDKFYLLPKNLIRWRHPKITITAPHQWHKRSPCESCARVSKWICILITKRNCRIDMSIHSNAEK